MTARLQPEPLASRERGSETRFRYAIPESPVGHPGVFKVNLHPLNRRRLFRRTKGSKSRAYFLRETFFFAAFLGFAAFLFLAGTTRASTLGGVTVRP